MGLAEVCEYTDSMSSSSIEIRPEFNASGVSLLLRRLARDLQPSWLHTEVASRMVQRLPLIRFQPQHLVQWWAGLGASSELLAKAYPRARQTWVEPSPEWLHRSQALLPAWWRRWPWAATQHQVVAESHLHALPSTHLIWANMMLHWVADPSRLMTSWRQILATDGFLMFSCLGPDTLRELRALYALKGWGASHLPFLDMHDLGDMLVHAGFADPVMDQECLKLTWAGPEAVLSDLRAWGANLGIHRFQGLRTPGWRRQLCQGLQEMIPPGQDRISMSFEIIYGHAFKAGPAAPVARETRISLGDMRAMVQRSKDIKSS